MVARLSASRITAGLKKYGNDVKAGKAAGLNTLNVKILDNSAPTQKQVKQLLDFATNPKNSPCYVHCEAGKVRTGVAVAAYRMAVEGYPLSPAHL